jgi:putative oxidoreductase
MFDRTIKNTLVPLLLRLGLATIFIYHGLGKINDQTKWGTAWNPELPGYQQILVAYGELIGGLALAFGFLTRLAALGLIVIMAGAIATVHWPNGFRLLDPSQPGKVGYEYNFAIIVMCVAVVLLGGGTLAVDRFFHMRSRRP